MNQMLLEHPPVPSRQRRKLRREITLQSEKQIDRPVRMATPEDRNSILDLCLSLHEENGRHPLALDKMEYLIDRGIRRHRAVLPIIGDPGDVRAMMLLFVEPVCYADTDHLVEMWNYVRPDSRRSSYGGDLLRFAMELSSRLGLDLTIQIISDHRLEAKTRMYERILGRAGACFVHTPLG